MADLVVSATFINPDSVASNSWDYGFVLRYGDGPRIYFVVTSKRFWHLSWQEGTGSKNQIVGNGSLSRFDTSPNGRNRLHLVAIAERGWLFVNDEFVSSLDLSNITGTGDVGVVTGFYAGNDVPGTVTRFEDFQGNRLTHSYGPASGRLEYEPGFISEHSSDVWARNFVMEAEFVNPSGNDWGYGFMFRSPESNRLELIGVTGSNWWYHQTRDTNDDRDTTMADSSLSSVSFRNRNHLLLLAIDEIGLFLVNEQLVAQLDLSHNLDYGELSAMGRFFVAHTGEPRFRNFNVWTMD